jgi:hypothetical protein
MDKVQKPISLIQQPSSQPFGIHCYTASKWLNGSENTGDVTEGLTTALDLQKFPVKDLREQDAQVFLKLFFFTLSLAIRITQIL